MLILSRSAMRQRAELSKYGSSWLATLRCVQKRMKGMRWEVEMNCLYRKDISPATKQQILQQWYSAKMIIHQNYLFSFVLQNISFHHRQHYSTTFHVSANAILIATSVVHMSYTYASVHHCHLSARLHLVCTHFIYKNN